MEHYSKTEWQAYRNGLIKDKQRSKMEKHLYQCDLCLDTYLQSIELSEIEHASSLLSKDFNNRTIKAIRAFSKFNSNTSVRKKSLVSENLRPLLYYTAAASIAVIFTFNGFIDVFTSKIPANIGGLPVLETKLDNDTPGRWSLDLMDKTISWVEILIENEEVKKE